jgi:hypothetical protein
MSTLTGYKRDTLADLLAIPADKRANGLNIKVLSLRSWFQFESSATTGGFAPDDNPSTGRWFPDQNATGVLTTLLTGFSVGSAIAIAATDTILQAFGKIQSLLNSKTDKLLVINSQTASYTLVLSDADKLVEMNVSTSNNNLTIPPNVDVDFPIGTQILIAQYGSGQTTLVGGVGVNLRSDGNKLKISTQYSGVTLVKRGVNEWYVFGSLAA